MFLNILDELGGKWSQSYQNEVMPSSGDPEDCNPTVPIIFFTLTKALAGCGGEHL